MFRDDRLLQNGAVSPCTFSCKNTLRWIFGMHVKMYQNAFYVQKKMPTLIYIIFVIKVTCSDFYEPSSNVFTYYLYDTHERYFVLFVPFVCKFMVLYWLTDWLCLKSTNTKCGTNNNDVYCGNAFKRAGIIILSL